MLEPAAGSYKWADGRSYQGQWKDGKQNGQGVIGWGLGLHALFGGASGARLEDTAGRNVEGRRVQGVGIRSLLTALRTPSRALTRGHSHHFLNLLCMPRLAPFHRVLPRPVAPPHLRPLPALATDEKPGAARSCTQGGNERMRGKCGGDSQARLASRFPRAESGLRHRVMAPWTRLGRKLPIRKRRHLRRAVG
jgi:hypothetical protein